MESESRPARVSRLAPEIWVPVKHLKAKGMLRHASVKQFITG
jgi:hypothetical protein